MSTTAANAHDVTEAHNLLHGGETLVWCDAGYQGVHKREENLGREVEWQVAMRPGKRRKLDPESAEALAEKAKASVRAKVEHPFLKVKRIFGYCQGALPGTGEEHGAAGAAFWTGQPADGGGPTDRLTWAAVGPNPEVGCRPDRSKPATAPPERTGRAEHLGTRPRKPGYFRETPPVATRKAPTILVQSVPRNSDGNPVLRRGIWAARPRRGGGGSAVGRAIRHRK